MRNQVGEWRPGVGVNVTDTAAFFEPGIGNVTLIVITILVSRYISVLSVYRIQHVVLATIKVASESDASSYLHREQYTPFIGAL